MQTVQPKLLQHSGYSHNCANQRLQPQLRLCGSGYSHNCPAFKGPVSAVSFALCLQSHTLCFEKYTSLVPSAFCSDICQAKKVSTILWTPNPSTDQAGTAAIAAFSTNILAMDGILKRPSSKSQARSNHSWSQQAQAASGGNSQGFLWQNTVVRCL